MDGIVAERKERAKLKRIRALMIVSMVTFLILVSTVGFIALEDTKNFPRMAMLEKTPNSKAPNLSDGVLEATSILYIEVPPGLLVKEELDLLTSQKMMERAREFTAPEWQETDVIVVYTQDGQPILPDLQMARENMNFQTTGNELDFTFNSPSYPWSASELSSLQTWLDDFYPLAKTIFGDPAFNIAVNIRKDPYQSYVGVYNPWANEITLRGLSDHVLAHEMIHAFTDDYIISFDFYTEGMTRAVEIEIFNQLPAYTHWDENHSGDGWYEHDNQRDVGAQNGKFFAAFRLSPLFRYQLAGYAWAKAYLEDNNFFVNFNRQYYARASVDSWLPYDELKLKDIVRSVKPIVEGENLDTWYSRQNIFNTYPPKGYRFLMQMQNAYRVNYFHRDYSGWETPQPGVTINWWIYDCNNNLLASGSDVTDSGGGIEIFKKLDYTGRIKTVVSTQRPEGEITAYFLRKTGVYTPGDPPYGVFGIVKNQTSGYVTVTPLDDPTPPFDADLINGSFNIPSFASIKGRFSIVYTDLYGREYGPRIFTKDASGYFVVVEDDRDLAITGIKPSKTVVGQGYPLNINVTIQNQGTSIPYAFTTAVYLGRNATTQEWQVFWSIGDANRDGYIETTDLNLILASWYTTPSDPNWNPDADLNEDLIINEDDLNICLQNQGLDIWTYFSLYLTLGETAIYALPDGKSWIIAFAWDTTGFAKANYTLRAYVWPLPDEMDVEDNWFIYGIVHLAMVGDITGPYGVPDGKVDIRDIANIATLFGINYPDSRYNPNCDIYYDLKIDIRDIAIAAMNFGKTDP